MFVLRRSDGQFVAITIQINVFVSQVSLIRTLARPLQIVSFVLVLESVVYLFTKRFFSSSFKAMFSVANVPCFFFFLLRVSEFICLCWCELQFPFSPSDRCDILSARHNALCSTPHTNVNYTLIVWMRNENVWQTKSHWKVEPVVWCFSFPAFVWMFHFYFELMYEWSFSVLFGCLLVVYEKSTEIKETNGMGQQEINSTNFPNPDFTFSNNPLHLLFTFHRSSSETKLDALQKANGRKRECACK